MKKFKHISRRITGKYLHVNRSVIRKFRRISRRITGKYRHVNRSVVRKFRHISRRKTGKYRHVNRSVMRKFRHISRRITGKYRHVTRRITASLTLAVALQPGHFTPGERRFLFPMDRRMGGPQSRRGYFWEDRSFSYLPGIEARYFGRPVRSLITILTKPSQFS
jgi:hypothetical protein